MIEFRIGKRLKFFSFYSTRVSCRCMRSMSIGEQDHARCRLPTRVAQGARGSVGMQRPRGRQQSHGTPPGLGAPTPLVRLQSRTLSRLPAREQPLRWQVCFLSYNFNCNLLSFRPVILKVGVAKNIWRVAKKLTTNHWFFFHIFYKFTMDFVQ